MTRRRAQPGQCPSCQAAVLRGFDADLAGWLIDVDPYQLTAATEAAALLSGLGTYRLVQGRLGHREIWDIRRSHPGPGVLVLAEHRCGWQLGREPLPRRRLRASQPEPGPVPY